MQSTRPYPGCAARWDEDDWDGASSRDLDRDSDLDDFDDIDDLGDQGCLG